MVMEFGKNALRNFKLKNQYLVTNNIKRILFLLKFRDFFYKGYIIEPEMKLFLEQMELEEKRERK